MRIELTKDLAGHLGYAQLQLRASMSRALHLIAFFLLITACGSRPLNEELYVGDVWVTHSHATESPMVAIGIDRNTNLVAGDILEVRDNSGAEIARVRIERVMNDFVSCTPLIGPEPPPGSKAFTCVKK